MKRKLRLQSELLLAASVLCLSLSTFTHAETYSYDGAGRLTGVIYEDDDSIDYSYDTNGNLLALVLTTDDQSVPNHPPSVMVAGGNRTISDTDSFAGELVSFAATATDTDGEVTSTEWLINNAVVATGMTPDITLPDGQTTVTFKATDDDGGVSTYTVTITVEAPELEEGWPVPYSGVTPPESLGLGFNNISFFNVQDGLIYSCLSVLVNGEQSNLDGIEEFDVGLEIVSLEEAKIKIVKVKPFNDTGTLNENGELPDCSGTIDLTTGIYTDLLLVGNDVLGVVFELFDPVNLILQLVDISLVGTIP